MTDAKGKTQTIVDWTGATAHPQMKALNGFDAIQPLKLYTNGQGVEGLHNAKAEPLEVHWDDFELYSGFSAD